MKALITAGGRGTRLQTIPTAASGRSAVRPAYSVFANEKWTVAAGAPLRPWHEALEAFLSTLALPARPR